MDKNAALFLLGAIIFASCPESPENATPDVAVEIPADLMGMDHAGAENDRENDVLNEFGVQWMLKDFSWSAIEPADDDWHLDAFDHFADAAMERGKKILALLAYDVAWVHAGRPDLNPPRDGPHIAADEIDSFCDYVRRTVAHYRGRVGAWIIWNEPNLQPRFWASAGTKEDFFALTTAAAAAIREADPDAVILGGSFMTLAADDWIRGLFTSGAMDQVDYVAYHPYMPTASTTAAVYNRFKSVVSDYGFGDKIWVTEVGYPTGGNYGTKVAEEQMPETVAQTITLLAAGGARRIMWYHIADPARQDETDSEDWFGLFKNDYTPKGGAYAYQVCARNIPGKTWRSALPRRSDLPAAVAAHYFEGADGRHTLVVWNERPSKPRQVTVSLPGTGQQVWNLATGEPASIEESSTYTLPGELNQNLRLFTWENADPAANAPVISAR
jgi:hypothetical protein